MCTTDTDTVTDKGMSIMKYIGKHKIDITVNKWKLNDKIEMEIHYKSNNTILEWHTHSLLKRYISSSRLYIEKKNTFQLN